LTGQGVEAPEREPLRRPSGYLVVFLPVGDEILKTLGIGVFKKLS